MKRWMFVVECEKDGDQKKRRQKMFWVAPTAEDARRELERELRAKCFSGACMKIAQGPTEVKR